MLRLGWMLPSVLVLAACHSPGDPPTDAQLAARFGTIRVGLESFRQRVASHPALAARAPCRLDLASLADAGLPQAEGAAWERDMDDLGLSCVLLRSDQVLFLVYVRDYFGPGAHVKGYAYAATTPSGTPRTPGRNDFETYAPLGGNWYLYEASND